MIEIALHRRWIACLTIAVALGAAETSTNADTLDTRAAQSIYIRNDTGPGTNQNGDTDLEDLVGYNNFNRLNILYEFNLSDIVTAVTTIGGGDFGNLTIDSVTLTVYERRGSNESSIAIPIDVRRYAFAFNESASTYLDPDGDGDGATGDPIDGGTFGIILSTTSIQWSALNASPDNQSATFATSTAFESAIANAAATDGAIRLLLAHSESTDGNQNRYEFLSIASDEYASTRRPQLIVNYTVTEASGPGDPIPTPAALSTGLTLLALLVGKRRRPV